MNAIIYVFSGTGNTRLAAKKIAEALRERGVETDTANVCLPYRVPSPESYDMVGLGYPIHAFNAPRIMRDFVKTLPETAHRKVFFFKTSGEPFRLNDSSSWLMYRILIRKGYEPCYEMHMLMPYNIMFRYPDALAKQMYLHTCGMCRLLAKDVTEGNFQKLQYRCGTNAFAAALRIQWFGARVNGHLLHADPEKCTGCGLCARRCPAGNIRIREKKARFGGGCTMCMRCAMYCPQDAVKAGFLEPWKVHGVYPFEKLARDETVRADFVNANTKGYFKLFYPYYRRTYAAMRAAGVEAEE